MLLDALHAVAVLLPSGAEVFLQGSRHGREYGLGSLTRVHHLPRSLLLLLLLHPLNVGEGLLHCHHKPRQQSTCTVHHGSSTLALESKTSPDFLIYKLVLVLLLGQTVFTPDSQEKGG